MKRMRKTLFLGLAAKVLSDLVCNRPPLSCICMAWYRVIPVNCSSGCAGTVSNLAYALILKVMEPQWPDLSSPQSLTLGQGRWVMHVNWVMAKDMKSEAGLFFSKPGLLGFSLTSAQPLHSLLKQSVFRHVSLTRIDCVGINISLYIAGLITAPAVSSWPQHNIELIM